MRSRLDEIVEEECIKGYDGTVAKRIAERAFRHGVERDRGLLQDILDGACAAARSGTTWWTPAHVSSPRDVQPAPAEEKANECQRDGTCPPFAHVFCQPNRRKGERRKGQEMCYAMSLDPGWWCLNKMTDHGCSSQSGLDRRSGKDRRKP